MKDLTNKLLGKIHLFMKYHSWLIIGVIIAFNSIILTYRWLSSPEIILDPSLIRAEHGFAYVVIIDKHISEFGQYDTSGNAARSPLVFLENGVALGPAHSVHQRIRDSGKGAYSHWNRALYFSASDNSDPRTNGRIYKIRIGLDFARFFWLAVIDVLLVFSVILINGQRWQGLASMLSSQWHWVFAMTAPLFIVYYNILFSYHYPIFLLIHPDSESYLSLSLYRTPGYPLIIQLVKALAGDLNWLALLQLNLLLIAIVSLGIATSHLLKNWFAGFVVLFLLMCNINIILLAPQLLTEAIFAALICFHLAAVLLLMNQFSKILALSAGLTLSAAILVRPAGYSLIIGVPALIVMIRSYWRPLALWFIGSVLMPLLLVSVFNYYKFGIFATQAFGGISLVGHVAWNIRYDPKSAYPQLSRAIENRLKPLLEARPALNFPHQYWDYTTKEYNKLLWLNVIPEIKDYVNKTLSEYTLSEKSLLVAKISDRLAIEAIYRNPGLYFKHVVAHYYGMWNVLFVNVGTFGALMNAYFETARSNFAARAAVFLNRMSGDVFQDKEAARKVSEMKEVRRVPDYIWWQFISLRNYFILSIFLISLAAPFWLFKMSRLSRPIRGLIYASIMLQCYFAFVATVQAALARYVQVFEPVAIVVLVVGYVLIWRWLCRVIRNMLTDSQAPLLYK